MAKNLFYNPQHDTTLLVSIFHYCPGEGPSGWATEAAQAGPKGSPPFGSPGQVGSQGVPLDDL